MSYKLLKLFMDIWDQLERNFVASTCPRCGNQWERRVKEPKGCVACRCIMWRHAEPVPPDYEILKRWEYLRGTNKWKEAEFPIIGRTPKAPVVGRWDAYIIH